MNLSLKQPSAWIQIALSLFVLGAIFIYIVLSGSPICQTDEGTGAHLFQIWLVLETVMILFYAITELPKMAVI